MSGKNDKNRSIWFWALRTLVSIPPCFVSSVRLGRRIKTKVIFCARVQTAHIHTLQLPPPPPHKYHFMILCRSVSVSVCLCLCERINSLILDLTQILLFLQHPICIVGFRKNSLHILFLGAFLSQVFLSLSQALSLPFWLFAIFFFC